MAIGSDHLTRPPPPRSVPLTAFDGDRGPARPEAVSRRVRRNRSIAALILAAVVGSGLWLVVGGGHGAQPPRYHGRSGHPPALAREANPQLDPDWQGNGKPVSMAFAGDVNFPSGSVLGGRLSADPSTALSTGVPALLADVDLSMVNLETAVTGGTCPDPQPKTYDFFAPSTALTALGSAGVTLTTLANNHGEDCGQAGLQQSLTARDGAGYPVLGIGQNVTEAFAPYQTVIDGEHIGIIAATQVIDSDLVTAWTATATQPGLASAYDVADLVSAVEAARRVDDTVVVFLHWGVQLDACPDPVQEPLANELVKAGAEILVGAHAHVLLGGGYLGSAYVDYGLGNFAFYNTPSPTNQSGALVVTATGRHVDGVTWRPATIVGELPVPLSGSAASEALQSWTAARTCTDLAADPGDSLASTATETSPTPASVAQRLSNPS